MPSHIHSVSGSTGGMSGNATGSVWSNKEGLFNSRNIGYNGNIKLSGSITWAGGDNEDRNIPTTMTIDVSHTHTASGSTGEMSQHSVFKHGGHTTYNSNSSNVTIVSYDGEQYNYSSSGRHNGSVYSIDISHTHSLSGSTGEMSQNATGWCAALIARGGSYGNGHSGNMSYDLTGPSDGNSGSTRGTCGRINIDVSHTHSLSGSTGGMSQHSVFNHGGHILYGSNSSNVTNVGIAEHYNYSNSGRHDGQVYSIDISHTHSVSGLSFPRC